MSLLRGTIKSKFGFIRSFKDMSLKELDFTSDDTDYMLESLDDIDEEFVPVEGTPTDVSSKKRVRNEEGNKTFTKKQQDYLMAEEEPEMVSSSWDDLIKKQDSLELKQLSSSAVQSKAVKSCHEATKEVDSEPELTEELPEQQNRQPSSSRQYLSSSLEEDDEEEIATSPTEYFEDEATVDEILEQLECVYREDRDLVVRKETGFISTPLHALKQLANKFNEPMHNEVMYVKMNGFNTPIVHVEIIVGVFRGVGEAFNKRMASQMASLDCLIRLERLGREDVLVPYAIFPGWRISPRICQDLLRICKRNGLKAPKYVTKSNLDNPEMPVSKVECYIGKSLVGSGDSDLTYVARKLSAYQAIEELTGEKYPLEFVALGSACIPHNELVKTGNVPELSEVKKQWVLDVSAQEEGADYVVDPQTLDALEQEVYQAEMKEIKNEKKKFKISIQTDAEAERNVFVE